MREKTIEIIKKYSEEKEITDETLLKDTGIDSLQVIEILMDLEDEFGINIPESDDTPFFTVRDLIDYVNKLKEGA